MKNARPLMTCTLLSLAGAGFAASITAIGDTIRVPSFYGVSADGKVVGGTVSSANSTLFTEGLRWTPTGGLVSVGPFGGGLTRGTVNAVSPDGGTLAGYLNYNNKSTAAIWTSTGWKTIGPIPTTGRTVANSASLNGAVIVGISVAPRTQAFRYTAAAGLLTMGYIAGNQPSVASSAAYDVSSDGSVVVGEGTAFFKTGVYPATPFRWTAATGMRALPWLTTKYAGGAAYAVSADGVYAVGAAPTTTGLHRAVRWSGLNAPLDLGTLPTTPASNAWSEAYEVNGDGSVVVGQTSCGTVRVAFYWTATKKMRGLIDVLRDQGADLTGWNNLVLARSVSKDGLTVVGQGVYKGIARAFIAKLDKVN